MSAPFVPNPPTPEQFAELQRRVVLLEVLVRRLQGAVKVLGGAP
jgi:hypothetical protein